jgi:asparagine synthase (glutamine-hydrolysing)
MPMSSPDGRYSIIHNGEVYNYRALREPLERKGVRFHSNTDTEVLLRLYEQSGPEMLPMLNGMFAFAIWDTRERTLFLARDRLGVKPLYYAHDGGDLVFASEEKALFAAGVPASFDRETIDELLCFRYVAGERTPLSGVKRLLPGSYIIWRGGSCTTRRWWDLGERVRELREEPPPPASWFRDTFDDAVRLRLISDVPVGVLLSGGLDSSSVAASIAEAGTNSVSSFTVRFPEEEFDEGPLARAVADRSGLRHRELTVAGDELLERLRAAAWINDEPLAHASDLHVAAISRFAKSHVSVLLSGEGSDEFLGGYIRYRPLLHPLLLSTARPAASLLAGLPGIPRRARKLGRYLTLGSVERYVLFNAAPVLPRDLARAGYSPGTEFAFRQDIVRRAKEIYPDEPFRQAMFSDQHSFLCSLLDRNDRMTMGASIECRVPFLDYRIFERLASMQTASLLPGGQAKALLRSAVGHRLPEQVLHGRKWGFGVPWMNYFRTVGPLRDIIQRLPMHPLVASLPFERRSLSRCCKAFLAGRDEAGEIVTALFMLSLWHDVYFTRISERILEVHRGRTADH